MTYFHGGFSTSILVYRRVNYRFWLNQTMASSHILVTPPLWHYGTATSHEPRNADAKVLGTLHHLSAVQHILRIRCCWDHGNTKGLDNKIVSSQTWEHVWYHSMVFYVHLCHVWFPAMGGYVHHNFKREKEWKFTHIISLVSIRREVWKFGRTKIERTGQLVA